MSDERQVEIDCLGKFRARAKKLREADPKLQKEIAFAMACEQLPATMNKYLHARSLLGMRGIAALPLYE